MDSFCRQAGVFLVVNCKDIFCWCGGFPTAGGICAYVIAGRGCGAPDWFECRFKESSPPDWQKFSEWVIAVSVVNLEVPSREILQKAIECGLLTGDENEEGSGPSDHNGQLRQS